MRVVLISTYELGRQPFGLVSPAAWLRDRGHQVLSLDLTRQPLDITAVRGAQLIAIYLPMHTATRLACKLIPSLRVQNPQAHICCYGLYAPMNAIYLRSLGVATVIGGEFEIGLAGLADRLASSRHATESQPASVHGQAEPLVSLDRLKFQLPDRSGLPPIASYAHLLVPGDGYRLVGSTEASRGCKHLCRHCPVVPVYNGVFRIVDRDVVLADVRQQVAAGAQHISFGDPDFFNGIKHSLLLIEAFHREFPYTTYDVTIKIEHLRRYEQHLALLRDTGCLFIISAVESVDDSILQRLDKGHSREDFLYIARKLRELGLTLHPTFVPFTPWTTLDAYLDLLRLIASQGLVENVAPIQLGIRLLIPEGSRLLELEEIRSAVAAFDAESLVYPWRNQDPRVDALSEAVQAIAADADRKRQSRSEAFTRIWQAAHGAAGLTPSTLQLALAHPVPILSEPWYCCAEPTKDQFVSIGAAAASTTTSQPAAVAADGFV